MVKVLEARQQRGIKDAPGREPSRAIPTGDELLAVGKANQTKISGRPVQGPVFDFAPVINQYLQAHLFGAIFERDNLDWQSRELATVGALAAMPGVEAQLRSHMGASLRVGLTAAQLRQLTQVLAERGDAQAAKRASEARTQALAAASAEEDTTIEEVYEPYLMQLGFLERTPRGRVMTEEAYQHLGLPFSKQRPLLI